MDKMRLYSPQECMEFWMKQKPTRGGKLIWLSIAKCIECAIRQDEIARELQKLHKERQKDEWLILQCAEAKDVR